MATVLCAVGDSSRGAVASALREAGWQVVESTTTDAAAVLARERRPDLLVIDSSLPGGTPPASLCRALKQKSPTRVLLLGGDAASADAADARLHAPAHPADVVTLARLMLESHEAARTERDDEALRVERDFTQAVLDTVPVLVVVLDADGRVVRFNAACETATGYREEEVLGRSYRMFIPDDELPSVDGVFTSLSMGDFPNHFENRWVAKDGRARLFAWSNTAIPGPDGRPRFIVGTGLDVTERKAAEDRLRESEERLRAIFDNVGLGIAEAAPSGRFVAVNERFGQLLGYRPEELLQRGIDEMTAPEDRERAREINGKILSGELERASYEKRYLRRDGTPTWVSVSLAAIRGQDGRPQRVVGTIEDIDERRRDQDRLRESEDRFRTLADNIAQFAWMADEQGSVDWYNRRWYEYTGTTLDEMQGWGWQTVHHPDHLPRVVEKFRNHVESGEPWEDTFPLRGKDGVYRWFLSRAIPIRDGSGKILRWFGTNTDITEQRAAEEALRDANNRLLDADRRKNEFLGMLSHELRNPMAPILNSLYIIEHTPPGGEQAHHAREVLSRQIGQMARMIDDLLDVTRIARGKAQLRKKHVDLAQVLHRLCDDYRNLMEERQLEFACSSLPPLCVYGDETRIGQIVGNLLQNAAKFTPAGGRVVLSGSAENGAAVIRVRDNGIGIDPDVLPRIFEAFTQATQPLARSDGGLGLGLALVKGLVELHGGTVTAVNLPGGGGAEFTVRLPLVERRHRGQPSNLEAAPRVEHKRVLVVDDNTDAAESLAEILRLLGHDVEVAHDGYEAIRKDEAMRPDVVLCDIGLPGLDGYEVARRLRSRRRAVRLVAISGYAQPEDLERSADAGFDAHLAKPASPERIQEALV